MVGFGRRCRGFIGVARMKKSIYDANVVWENLCKFVEEDDGLPTFKCGNWTIDKLRFLCTYLTITTTAMKDNQYFSSINYIDLFCGSGVCKIMTDNFMTKRYPGSALIAAGCPKPFDNIYLVDEDNDNINALNSRLNRLDYKNNVKTYTTDANKIVKELCRDIPESSLSVAFIDPFNLGFNFNSLGQLTLNKKIDLIILFADSMDIQRNVDQYYYNNQNSKLDLMLGSESGWRVKWDKLDNRDSHNVLELFRKIYIEQIETLGYNNNTIKPIMDNGKPLYSLVYASKNNLGLKFWNEAVRKDRDGQTNLWSH